jgi:hypothetical protein
MDRVVSVEYGPCRRHYEVNDPEVIRRRANLINSYPVLLFVQACRVEKKPLLATIPQQSDYVTMWTDSATHQPAAATAMGAGARIKRFVVERLPRLARFLEAYKFSSWNRDFSFRDRGAFKRVR